MSKTNKVRVFELARELALDNNELLRRLKSLGIPVSSHMSTLDVADAERFRQSLEKEKQKDKEKSERNVETLRMGVVKRRAVTKAPSTEASPQGSLQAQPPHHPISPPPHHPTIQPIQSPSEKPSPPSTGSAPAGERVVKIDYQTLQAGVELTPAAKSKAKQLEKEKEEKHDCSRKRAINQNPGAG
ncbi:MAG: translation initiation factor IF-2 N-terminal domain-containing protein [Sandaracinaceae bacterium]|nr:translation initiation factor IF-2 N-terminal domain-containing protein [Sandaracinaceae bacterium]